MPTRIAYMPLITYPDVVPDESVAAAVDISAALGCSLHATAFAVDIQHVSTPLGGLLIGIPEMIRTTEENSRAHCRRLERLVIDTAGSRIEAKCSHRNVAAGTTSDAATAEARYFDLGLLPWSKEHLVIQDLARDVVFGAGRPCILVPPSAGAARIGNVAVAWDASRVAARALADVMPLLAENSRITVLTVKDEKPLDGDGLAETLAASLKARGFHAEAHNISLGRRTIAEALQDAALEAGAELLAMGGFGHSRLRDFVLGGATKGVFSDLRLAVLLSH